MKDLLYYQAVLLRLFPRFSLIFVDVTPRKPTNTSVRFDIYACQVGVKDGNYVVRMELPLTEVLYLKAALKYIRVRSALKTHILEGSLSELEAGYPSNFLRIHRNALVATHAIRALEKHFDPDEGDGWAVRLSGIDDLLMVSRRQLAAVKEVISK